MDLIEYQYHANRIVAQWICPCGEQHRIIGFDNPNQFKMYKHPKVMCCSLCKTDVCIQFTKKGLKVWK